MRRGKLLLQMAVHVTAFDQVFNSGLFWFLAIISASHGLVISLIWVYLGSHPKLAYGRAKSTRIENVSSSRLPLGRDTLETSLAEKPIHLRLRRADEGVCRPD